MASIIVNGNGGSDTLTQAAQPGNSATLQFNGNVGGGTLATDTLNVNAGTYTFLTPTTGGGIQALPLAALSIANGASVILPTAAAHSDRWVLTTSTLSLGGATSKLDLGGNDLILHNTNSTTAAAALTNITAELAAGYADGAWNGVGISSSAIAASNNSLLALGVMLNNGIYSSFDNQPTIATDLLVKFTYYGDANLDGKVDGSDYSRIDNGYLGQLTGWFNGDFNYDGVIDGSDYTLIDNAYNTQGVSLAAQIAKPSASVGARPTFVSPTGLFSDAPIADQMKKPHRSLVSDVGLTAPDMN
jgi:hypothetical protein